MNGNGVEVRTINPLAMHEGLTVAVAFDKGFVRPPSPLVIFGRFLVSNWPLIIPILALPIMFWWWWHHGRDPRLRPIAAQYEPPDKLTPGEVGTLIDNSVDMRDITASIVDLAVRGYIVIEEKQKDHLLGLTHSKDYLFHLQKSQADWPALKPHEQELLRGIFPSGNAGDIVSLADLHNRFYQNIPGYQKPDFRLARRPGLLRPASRQCSLQLHWLWHRRGFMLFGAGNWFARNYGMAPLPFIIAGIF